MTAPPGDSESTERRIRREHLIDLVATVGLVFLMIIAVRTTVRLTHVLALFVVAAVLAYLTAPLRTALSARIGHGLAAALVPILTFVAIVGIGVAVSSDASDQASRLADVLNGRIQELAPTSLPGRIAKSIHAQEAIDQALSSTGTSVVAGETSTSSLARPLSDLFLVVIIGAFIQGSGPAVVARVIAAWPRSRRRAIWDGWKLVDGRAGAMYRRSLLLGLITASALALACAAMGIPGGLIMGAWAGLWAPIQVVGPVLGFGPFFVVALVQVDASPAVALVVGLTICMGSAMLRRVIRARSELRPGPATWVLAYAISYAVAGTAGLIVAPGAVAFLSAFLSTPIEPAEDSTAVEASERRTHRLFGVDGTEEWWRSILSRRGVAVIGATCVSATLAWVFLESLGVFAAWLFIALLLAVGLDRPASALVRRFRLPRSVSIVVVLVCLSSVIAGVFVLALQGGPRNGASLSSELPKAVRRFEDAPLLGPFLRQNHAADWVRDQLDNLPDALASTKAERNLLPAVGARFGDLFWTLALTISLLVDGPRLLAELRRRLPVRHRRQFGTLLDVAGEAVGGYLAGSAVIAALDALFVLTLALTLGVPLAPALAGWAFFTNFIPQIGGLLGGTPLVVLAFTVGPVQAAIALAGFLTYQLLENHLIGPSIISKTTDISPVTSLLAALVGGAAGGMIGALLLTPIVAAAKVMHDLTRRGQLPGQAVGRSTPPPDESNPAGPRSSFGARV